MRAKKILSPVAVFFIGYLIYSRWDSIAAFGEDPLSLMVFLLAILFLAMGIYRVLNY